MKRRRATDNEVVEAFVTLGLKEKQAKILTFALRHDEGVTQHEIERSLDLRQPEVSSNLNELIRHKWVSASGQLKPRSGRARPTNIYTPIKSTNEIVDDLRMDFENKCERVKKSILVISAA